MTAVCPSRRGFTLIELLLVVLILGMLAASTSVMVDGAHDQARYDDTRKRLDQIRRAIVGPEDLTAPLAGYVADMGAPPTSLRDLLVNPNGATGWYTVDAATGVGAGWRGPYLRALPRRLDGALEFPDGWGTPDQVDNDPNFGWRFDRAGEDDLRITSRGADGVIDYVADASTGLPIARLDHHVDIGSWHVEVTINFTGTPGSEGLALRAWEPSPAGLATATPDDDLEAVVGDRNLVALAAQTVVVLEFATAAPLSRWVSQGVRAVELGRHDGTTFTELTPRQIVLVDLRARAALPTRLARTLTVGP